jgi:hypothetical protein
MELHVVTTRDGPHSSRGAQVPSTAHDQMSSLLLVIIIIIEIKGGYIPQSGLTSVGAAVGVAVGSNVGAAVGVEVGSAVGY